MLRVDDNLKWVLKQLLLSGFDSRFVGGCVRDSIRGVEYYDVDIATVAKPDEVTKIFTDLSVKVIPTGIKHGTVTVIYKNSECQITTLRRDTACDGRHASVEFTDSFLEDSNRRDFTFNALYMDIDGGIEDFHNGIKDLQKRIVRFIGNPEDRIQEDYLRILRYYRFCALIQASGNDLGIYDEVISKYSSNVRMLSNSRVGSEFLKMLSIRGSARILLKMVETGVLENIISYDLSGAFNEIFDELPKLGKLSVINRSEDVKTRLALSNREYSMLKFFNQSIAI